MTVLINYSVTYRPIPPNTPSEDFNWAYREFIQIGNSLELIGESFGETTAFINALQGQIDTLQGQIDVILAELSP